ncbi:MAG: hypothetical protein SGILL_002207 [Bacillariaceae sp.]
MPFSFQELNDDCCGDVGMETIPRKRNVWTRSESVMSKGSVVESLFKVARHATKEDEAMANQKYQSINGGGDNDSSGSPPVWEEEVFVACGSFGDVDDGDDAALDETSYVESIRIVDGPDGHAMVSRDAVQQFNHEALNTRHEDFCTDNMNVLCINKDEIMDEASQILMDSPSWEKFVGAEDAKVRSKKNRFGWILGKSKEEDVGDGNSTITGVEDEPHQPDGVEMMLCGALPGCDDGEGSKGKKHSSSWTPRLVRRTRLKNPKKSKSQDRSLPLAEQAAVEMDTEPLIEQQETASADETVVNAKREAKAEVRARVLAACVSFQDEEEAAVQSKQGDESSHHSKETFSEERKVEDEASVDDSAGFEAVPKMSAPKEDKAEDDADDAKSTSASVKSAAKKSAAAKSISSFVKKALGKSKTPKEETNEEAEDSKSTSSSVNSATKVATVAVDTDDAKSQASSVKSTAAESTANAKESEEDDKSEKKGLGALVKKAFGKSKTEESPEEPSDREVLVPPESLDDTPAKSSDESLKSTSADEAVAGEDAKSTSSAKSKTETGEDAKSESDAKKKGLGALVKKALGKSKSSSDDKEEQSEETREVADEEVKEAPVEPLASTPTKSGDEETAPVETLSSTPTNASDESAKSATADEADAGEDVKSESDTKKKGLGALVKKALGKSKSSSDDKEEPSEETREVAKEAPVETLNSIPTKSGDEEPAPVETLTSTPTKSGDESVKSAPVDEADPGEDAKSESNTKKKGLGALVKKALGKSKTNCADKEEAAEEAKEANVEALVSTVVKPATDSEECSSASVKDATEEGGDTKSTCTAMSAVGSVKSESPEKKAAAKSIGAFVKKAIGRSKPKTDGSPEESSEAEALASIPAIAPSKSDKSVSMESEKSKYTAEEDAGEPAEDAKSMSSAKSTSESKKKTAAKSIGAFMKKAFSKSNVEQESEPTKMPDDDITPPSAVSMSRRAPTPPVSETDKKAKSVVEEMKKTVKVSTLVDKGTQTGDSLDGPSPNRVGDSEEIPEQPLRRTATDPKDRVVQEDEEEEIAKKSKFGFLNLRRISSDFPKTEESKKKNKMKSSKPLEIHGHLTQPCPSDITEGTGDDESKLIVHVASQEMETIDEAKDSSEKESFTNTFDAATGTEKTPSESKLDDKDEFNSEAKGKVTFMDRVLRRTSSDAPVPEKEGEGKQKLNAVEMQKSTSELPRGSTKAEQYAKESEPLDVETSSDASVSVALDGSIIKEEPESTVKDAKPAVSKLQEDEDHRVAVALQQEEDAAAQSKDTESLKISRSSAHIPANNLLDSIGKLFGSSKKEEDDKEAKLAKEESQATSAKPADDEAKTSDEKDAYFVDEDSVEVQAAPEPVEIKKEEDISETKEQPETAEEKPEPPAVVNAEDKLEASSNLSSSTHDDDLKGAVVSTKKSKRGSLKFWKRSKSSKKEATTVEESKYDSGEENSRGSGSHRDGPASDRDSASGKSSNAKDEDAALLIKLKKMEVPEASSPKFERPLSQEEGLKQMNSMRVSDPAEVEKCLGIGSDDDSTMVSKKSKKKGLEGILKKNNRFSGVWQKKQKLKVPEQTPSDDVHEESTEVAPVYATAAAEATEDGVEAGFEIGDESGFEVMTSVVQKQNVIVV